MSLELQSLKKSFSQGGKKWEILKGIDASIKEGSIVAIVGKSGSGKSTLLSLLAGLDTPDSGDVLLQGTSISKMPTAELHQWRGKNIGIVFQQFHLLPHLTALENVELPLEILGSSSYPLAKDLLNDLGLSSRMNHLPTQLSGGECQRVAIARALVTQPKLLLADEPSGSLDVDTGEQVMESFFTQARRASTTTILVTHNEELAKRCDRQLLLEHGLFKEL